MGLDRNDSYSLFQPEIYLLNELYKNDCDIHYEINDCEGDLYLYKKNNNINSVVVKTIDWKYIESKNRQCKVMDINSFKFHVFLLDECRSIINYKSNKDIIDEFNVIAFKEYDLNTVVNTVLKYLNKNIIEKNIYEAVKSEVEKLNFSKEEKEDILNICYRKRYIRDNKVNISKTEIIYMKDLEDKPLISHLVEQAVRYYIDKKIYVLKTDNRFINPQFISDNEAKEYKINKDKIFFYTENEE